MNTRFSKLSTLSAAAVAALLCGATSASAQEVEVLWACYQPNSGIVYRVNAPDSPGEDPKLKDACASPQHALFSWTDGEGADHGALSGLADDDHPHYLLVDGSRALSGNLSAAGNTITGLAAPSANGEAVRFDEAVLDGDAAGGDLAGSYPDPSVVGLQGYPVANAAPGTDQLLGWDGSAWTPMDAEMVIDDHGNLMGLGDDDHSQYLLTNGVRSSTGFSVNGSFGAGSIPATGSGIRLMWHPAKAAFRVGSASGAWDDADIGNYSMAMGIGTMASGNRSTALGDRAVSSGAASTAMGAQTTASGGASTAFGGSTVASGDWSLAAGRETTASGLHATAFGRSTDASGANSFAAGLSTTASGVRSIAFGVNTTASGINAMVGGGNSTAQGDGSFAFGGNVATRGRNSIALGANAGAPTDGSFVFGDGAAGSTRVTNIAANQFYVRASGGTRFYSSADLTTGVFLAPGSGAWGTLSDRNMKDNVRPEDPEAVLTALAGIPVASWNYRAQDPSIRHLGPMAQDFFAAFKLGESELSISTVDIDGVNMLAIQALELRTRELEALKAKVSSMEQRLEQLDAIVARLEAKLDGSRR